MKTKQILEKYSKKIIANGKILDIGFDNSRNAIWLAEQGFEVTTIDKNREAFDNLRKRISELGTKLKIKLENKDIKKFQILQDYYNAIIAFNSLIFLKKSEFLEIVAKIKKVLMPGGLVFISLFTMDDPSFKTFLKRFILSILTERIRLSDYFLKSYFILILG